MDGKQCASCSELITDPYVYEVDGRLWHEKCLRCSMCLSILDPNLKCFMRDNQFFCREDFVKYVFFLTTFPIRCWHKTNKILITLAHFISNVQNVIEKLPPKIG